MLLKIIKSSIIICISALICSCDKNEEAAKQFVYDFLQASFEENDSLIKARYPYFSLLQRSHVKVNPKDLELQDIDIFDFRSEKSSKNSEKYRKKYGKITFDSDTLDKVYVFTFTGIRKCRFEVYLKGDKFDLNSYNFYKPKENRVAFKTQGVYPLNNLPFEVLLQLDTLCDNDSQNKSIISYYFLEVLSTSLKMATILNGNKDSLDYYYPEAVNFDAIRTIDIKNIKSFNLIVHLRANNNGNYFETEYRFNNGETSETSYFFIINSTDSDPKKWNICNSKGFYSFEEDFKYLQNENTSISRMDLALMYDVEIFNLISEEKKRIDEEKKLENEKIAKREKYARIGLVIRNIEMKKGHDREGYPTSGIAFSIFNPTQKTIKYVIANVIGINGVGDATTYNKELRGIGPIDPQNGGSYDFSDAFRDPNGIIEDFNIRFKVIYTDGSSKNINPKDAFPDIDFSESLWF